jgi:hypothetical protein
MHRAVSFLFHVSGTQHIALPNYVSSAIALNCRQEIGMGTDKS